MALYDHYKNERTGIYNWCKRVIAKKIVAYMQHFVLTDKPILEIGVGKGEIQQELNNALGNRVYGLDQNEYCLQYSSNPVLHSLPSIPFEDGHFDSVISSHCFEHLVDYLEVLETFESVRRVLMDNGYFFLIVPDYLSWKQDFFDVDYSHSVPFTKRRIEQLAKDNGFEIIAMIPQCGWLQGTTALLLNAMWKMFPLKRIHPRIVRAGYCLNKDIFAVLRKCI